MQTAASVPTDQFADLLERLPADLDLDHLALETKAIQRKRKIGDGASLLRLALARGPGGFSLRQTSGWVSLLEIVELSNPGVHSRETAATVNGMTRQTLRDWVHRYNAEGVSGLWSRTGPGRPPRLTDGQMEELKAVVINGPDPDRHEVVRWRCVDLREEITARWSVTVCEQTVGTWLRRLGMTRLQPRPYHPKKDPKAEAAFKKRARVAGPPVALETGRAILRARGAAEKFLVDLTP